MEIPNWGKYSLAAAALVVPMLIGQSNPGAVTSPYASTYFSVSAPSRPIVYSTNSFTAAAAVPVSPPTPPFYGAPAAPYPALPVSPPLPVPLAGRFGTAALAATGSESGGAVVAGGENATGTCLPAAAIFDEEQDQWVSLPQMPEARAHAGVIKADDNNLYVIGGDDCHGTVFNTVERFDGTQWEILGSGLNIARTGLAVVEGNNGNVYAIGGTDSNGSPLNSVEVYQPTAANPTWQPAAANLQTARAYLGAVVGFDNTIYAVGGMGESGNGLASIEALPSSRAQWQVIGALHEARGKAGVVLDEGGRITAVGGQNGSNLLRSVEIYDPTTNQSTDNANSLSAGLADPSVTFGEDGNILVSGGLASAGPTATAEELDLPARGAHSITLYLHGATEPTIDGSLAMDRNLPPANSSVGSVLNLGQSTSWVSDPTFTGSFGSGASAVVTQACTASLSVAPTYTLSAASLDDDSEQVLGTATPLLGLCLGTSSVTIPLPAINLQNRALKLSISNGVGVNLNLSGAGNTLQITNFAGEP